MVRLQNFWLAFTALKSADWYDESDAQTDYFNTAVYVDINVGKWRSPTLLRLDMTEYYIELQDAQGTAYGCVDRFDNEMYFGIDEARMYAVRQIIILFWFVLQKPYTQCRRFF
jgi:hypothetical protein